MQTPFSLRYQRISTDTTAARDAVANWLQTWGIAYQRDVLWHAHDPNCRERFTFTLDFLILPMHGRHPSDYLLLDIHDTRLPVPLQGRYAARRQFLHTLWMGRMVSLDTQLLRLDPSAAQIRLLNAL